MSIQQNYIKLPTKADLGLSNVANLAPADLPLSTIAKTQLDTKPTFFTTLTSLRAINPVEGQSYYLSEKGKEGFWYYDPLDVTSLDDGVLTLVSSQNKRLKRVLVDGKVYSNWVVNPASSDHLTVLQTLVNKLGSIPSGYYGETNGKTLCINQGTIRLSGPLIIPENSGISVIGEGSTKSNIFTFNGTDAIHINGNNYRGKIEGIRFAGPQSSMESSAIKIMGSGNQINVLNCWGNTYNCFIEANPVADIIVQGNTLEYISQPLSFTNSYDLSILGNTFYNCGPQKGGTEQPATYYFNSCKRVLFQGNKIINDSPQSPQSTGIIRIENSEKINVSNNMMEMTNVGRGNFIRVDNSENIIINGNTLPKSFFHTVFITNSNLIILSSNTFVGGNFETLSADYRNVQIEDSSNVSVIGNGGDLGEYATYNVEFNNVDTLSLYANTFASSTYLIADNCKNLTYNIGENEGELIANGDGINRFIYIEHKLGSKPKVFHVSPKNLASAGNYSLNANNTYLILEYEVPPVTGTQNLAWDWYARL